MNSHLVRSLMLAGVLIAGCQKPVAETDGSSPPAPKVSATPIPVAVASATPAPSAVAPPTATPAPEPLAPEGVVFLLVKTSVTTDEGIIGLKPGTRLAVKAGGQYADAEGHTLALRDDQVTNNLRRAGVAAGADAAAQAALRQTAAQWNRTGEENRAAALQAAAESKPAPVAPRVTEASAIEPSAPGMSKAYGQKKAFVDRDGDGRGFGLSGREHTPPRSMNRQ